MNTSILSLIVFSICTFCYYIFLIPKLNISVFDDKTGNEYISYTSSKMTMLLIYFLFLILAQVGINASIIVNKCGGSITQNIGTAFLMTLIPWIVIFGGVIGTLMIFPGFKSAFSNVIGFFVVSKSANNVLSELLENTEMANKIDNTSDANPEQKTNLKHTADAIIKIFGDTSLLINQIVPSNFAEYWSILTPLMKKEYQNNPSSSNTLKQQLLDVVIMRDNIGEAIWYIYTAIFLISITQYAITSQKCATTLATLQSNYSTYQTQTAATAASNAVSESTVYTS